jgi:integrase
MRQTTVTLYHRVRNEDPRSKTRYQFKVVPMGKGRKPSGPFYLRHTNEHGKQKWVAAGDDYAAAFEKLEQLRAGLTANRHGLTVPEMEAVANVGRVSVNDCVTEYLKLKSHKSKRTVQAYKLTLQCFLDTLPSRVKFVDEITDAVLRNYQDQMTSSGLAPKTVRNRMSNLSFFLKRMKVKTNVQWSELPTVEEQPVKAFTTDQLCTLFGECDDEEHAVFTFYLNSGCREGEVAHMEWSDVDWHHHTLTVRAKPQWRFAPKTHEARHIPVSGDLLAMLKRWRQTRERIWASVYSTVKPEQASSTLIFPNADGRPEGHFLRMLKRVAYRAGMNCGQCTSKTTKLTRKETNARLLEYQEVRKKLPAKGFDAACAELDAVVKAPRVITCKDAAVCKHFHLHRFRKTFATKLHRDGAPLVDLQKWLGHKSLLTTQKYLAESDLKAAHIRSLVEGAFKL